MDRPQAIGALFTLTALYYYLNHRWLRLPVTIGVMVIALGLSALIHQLASHGVGIEERVFEDWLREINFNKTVLHGMLGVLLFSGALQLDLHKLLAHKWSIGLLATVGVLASTLFIGTLMWWGLHWLGIDISYAYCLVFGALISPTDAIVVMSALKKAHVPKPLEMAITGEALFNDGAAIVVFSLLLGLATGTDELRPGALAIPFLREAVGGILLGLGYAYLVSWMLKMADDKQLGILVTLAVATGGYALADALQCSGPIAVAVSGLMLGYRKGQGAISPDTRIAMETFWQLMDHVYNAVLFAMLGMEFMLLQFTSESLVAGLAAICLVLVGRLLSVGMPALMIGPFRALGKVSVAILTWGGLRGSVSVALALSIPRSQERDIILAMTYIVVIFSIVAQGLTMEKMVERSMRNDASRAP